MFIAFSLEPNYILSIILLLIANQALSFQSMFQTGSRIIIFFFCRWHLFIPCAKTVTSDLRVVKLDHSFRNNSIFFHPLCMNQACIGHFMRDILFEPCFCLWNVGSAAVRPRPSSLVPCSCLSMHWSFSLVTFSPLYAVLLVPSEVDILFVFFTVHFKHHSGSSTDDIVLSSSHNMPVLSHH